MSNKLAGVAGLLLLGACNLVGRTATKVPPDKSAILASATTEYSYDPNGESPIDASLPPGSIDNSGEDPSTGAFDLKIYKATYTGSATKPSYGEVLAKITASRAYPKLNIQNGVTYIWRNAYKPNKGDNWTTYMVPEQIAKNPMELIRHNPPHEYLDKNQYDPTMPHLVRVKTTGTFTTQFDSFGVCFDDPACGSMHCGYSSVQ